MQSSIYSFVDVLLKANINLIKLFKVEQDDLFMILSTKAFIILLEIKS